MSVLYIRDADGRFIQIPSIPGKSAYEIAVEKGVFEGTEQEFAEMQVFSNKSILEKITQDDIDSWNNTKGMTDEEKEQLETNTENILKIMEAVDEPPTYTKPVVNLSASKTTVEHNVSTGVVLTPSFSQNDAGSLQKYTLKKGNQTLYEGSLQAYTDTIILTHNNTITYTATVSYGDGIIKNTTLGIQYPSTSIKASSISTTKQVKAYAPTYYGVINTNNISGVDGLTSIIGISKSNTLTFTLTNQHIVYMYPKSFGNLTSIKDANNFDYINSYTLTTTTYNGVEYNVYILTDAVTINGFKQIYI